MAQTPTVQDIMTQPVVTVDMDCPVAEVGRIFRSQGFHHLLVVNQGRLFGVISDRDFLRTVSPFVGTDQERSCDGFTLKRPVHQIMSRKPWSCGPATSVHDAAELMLDRQISCLPVVDAEGFCVGVVTLRDIARWAMRQAVAGAPKAA